MQSLQLMQPNHVRKNEEGASRISWKAMRMYPQSKTSGVLVLLTCASWLILDGLYGKHTPSPKKVERWVWTMKITECALKSYILFHVAQNKSDII
jgi:hypothetical protein